MLICDDIPAAHVVLVDAFGFTTGGVTRDSDGNPVHGEVKAGEMTIWLHRANPEDQLTPSGASPSQSSGLAVLVSDVDAHYEHARTHGAVVDGPPLDQPYGRREYGARDREGHRWWFGTAI